MNTGNQFLKSKGLIKPGNEEFVIVFEGGEKVNLGELLQEYSRLNYNDAQRYRAQLVKGRDGGCRN